MHNDFNPIMTSLNDTQPYSNDSKFLLLHDALLLTSSVCIDKNAFFCQSCTNRSMQLLYVSDKMIECTFWESSECLGDWHCCWDTMTNHIS